MDSPSLVRNGPVDSIADFTGLNSLKRSARDDADGAMDEVALKFESMFIQMMLKSMRDAGTGDDIMGGESVEFFRDMSDQQLSLHLAEKGGGLGIAKMITDRLRQEDRQVQANPVLDQVAPQRRHVPVNQVFSGHVGVMPADKNPAAQARIPEAPLWHDAEGFVKAIAPYAKQAAQVLGAPWQSIAAQAVLETGWGQKVPQTNEGSSSFNVFGIKANTAWQGESLSKNTLEFDGSQMQQQTAKFRVYDSLKSAFEDYSQFLLSNPRYADVVNGNAPPSEYANNLQDAGYATDPRYAKKIEAITQGELFQVAVKDIAL